MHGIDPDTYEIDREMAAARQMLKVRIPRELNTVKLALIENRQAYEPWRLALTVDFVESVERNCRELLEAMVKDRLPAAAWIARNLLEVWVWVRYCGVSRENAWRFHEDALRDLKGLMESYKKGCDAMRIPDKTSALAAQRIQEVASKELGLEDISANYLTVSSAAKSPSVDLGERYGPFNQVLSKFAHPTAGLLHGIAHQPEACRQLQASFTTMGVYFTAQITLALEAQLELPSPP